MPAESLRILLIDDNQHGLVARRELLRGEGYKVEVASSGQEGLDAFSARAFDLVVTDYRMPGMSGQQVIRKIRQQKPGVPIVLLTGYAETLGLSEESTGADIVVSKGPREVRDLLRVIARFSGRRAAKPPARAPGPRPAGKRKAG